MLTIEEGMSSIDIKNSILLSEELTSEFGTNKKPFENAMVEKFIIVILF
jgi:hypothetical protein